MVDPMTSNITEPGAAREQNNDCRFRQFHETLLQKLGASLSLSYDEVAQDLHQAERSAELVRANHLAMTRGGLGRSGR